VAVRTGYILCYILRILELLYEYGNRGVRLPEQSDDITCMASAVSQRLFGGRLSLIFMHSVSAEMERHYSMIGQPLAPDIEAVFIHSLNMR